MRKENKKRIARVLAVLATTLTIALTICLPMSAMVTVSTPTTQFATQGETTFGYEMHIPTQYTGFTQTSEEGNPWLPVRIDEVGRVNLQLSRPYLNEVTADETYPPNGTDFSYGDITYNDTVMGIDGNYFQENFNITEFTNDFDEKIQLKISATDIGTIKIYPYEINGFNYITINVKMKNIYTWFENGGKASQELRLKIPTASIVNDIYIEGEGLEAKPVTEPMIYATETRLILRPLDDYTRVYDTDANYEIEKSEDGNTILIFKPPTPTRANEDTVYEIEEYNINITARVLRGLTDLPIQYELGYIARTDIQELRYHMIKETRYKLPPIVDLTEWLGESISAFMNFQLVEGITIGGVFTVLIGFSVVMWLLKMFAGG